MRTMEAAVIAALTASSVRPCFLLEIELASTTLRYWTGNKNLSWDSKTWTADNFFKSFGAIRESGDLSAEGVSIELAGEPATLVSMHLQEMRQNKPVSIYLGFLDEARALITDPILMFKGKVDASTLDDDTNEATLTISAESVLIDLERAKELRYNHECQQSLYSGDLFFEYVEQLQDAHFFWGKKPKKNKKKKKGGK